MLVLAAFLVVAWLPGAVLFRVPWFDRPRRAQLAAEERLYWTVMLSVVASLAWVLVLAAAHRYSFRALLVADSLTAVVVAAMARFDLRLGPSARWPGTAALVPLALVILSAWRFLPPSEYIIGGKDPGVYLNEGIQIAQRGGLIVADETVAAVPAFARPLFFPTDVNRPYYLSLRFMGFYIRDPDTGAVISQFQHAFPAAIAIGYGLGGLTGARRAVVACAMLGVLGLYFAGARLFGRPTAAAAATLLVLNVIELWFARYPNVEVLIQALLIASLLAAARAQVDGDPFFAPVTGVLLGMLLFTRFDAALVVVAVIAAQALGYVALTQRMHWTFWPALAIPASLCGWYLVGPMRAYSELPLAFVARLPWGFYAAFVAGCVALLAIVVSAHRSPWTATRVRQLVPAALAVIVTLLAVYAFEFRHPGDRLAAADADALRTFAIFYVTVPALIAAVIGYAVDRPDRVLARPGAAADVHGVQPVLFLQAADRPGALLGGPPVRADHPARHAPAGGRRGAGGRPGPVATPARAPRADRGCLSRPAGGELRARVTAGRRPRGVRGRHPQAGTDRIGPGR